MTLPTCGSIERHGKLSDSPKSAMPARSPVRRHRRSTQQACQTGRLEAGKDRPRAIRSRKRHGVRSGR